ncbi:Rne/Rng family ribonuclease [Geitlerinema sp. PCC 7407]|uniref:Rne/Rng family ribonuclease n=1 Tax=Geitlerinema sp. PCC 7407 TaxID=1173025 RepID=UPI00029FB00A|nr:Rne/Rng family ribonuclease [Geitlerinema sp. PCC 7407]AFY67311.1 ribonuclease, Rne/Rng family [Geitlerinema sp. PCC 7407]
MPKQIVIAEQHRVAAVFSEDQIQELIVAKGTHQISDIYLGVVENVLPGIDAAFVNIGDAERNGFIHVSDLGPLRLKRSAGAITELLTPQQKVLVQVMKEPTGNKGPRLTGNITMPGRYLVLMPFGRGVNLSRRIRNENERNRLRALAILVKPAGMGLLVRTEAEGMAEEAIIEDLEFLQRQWETVQQEASSTRAPALLNRDDDFIQRVLRDVYSADVNRIVVDSSTGVKRVKQHLTNWGGGKSPQGVLIDHHRDRTPLLEYFRVNAAIREALKPRVDLPSGGYIIIEPTEALTVIDVNSGSFTRSATARETVLWTNCEAATEIARQLRLRNVAGVIIVDFIDMDSRRDQLQVLEHFNKALKADKARPQIAQLSELGLVELTRKRQGQNIYELFGRRCPTCDGLGHLVHLIGDADTKAESLGDRSSSESRFPQRSDSYGSRTVNRKSIRPVIAPEVVDEPDLSEDEDFLAEMPETEAQEYEQPPEQPSSNGSRRRRRRRPEGGTDRREEAPKGVSDRASNPVSEPDEEPGDQEAATPRPERAERTLERSDRSERPERSDRPERSRGRRGSAEPSAPPEQVTVKMTAEEQDVYALMGISPLILAPQEVKNPKTAVVSVVLPGEEGTTAEPVTLLSFEAEEPEAESSESPAEEPEVVAVVSSDRPVKAARSSAPENRRRRRRRSSAAESGNESDS